MAKTVRDALVTALENLEDLKKFCNKIRDWEIEEGYSRIPLSKLKGKDAEEVVDVILDFYTDQYGPRLTVAVLHAINQKVVAKDLQRDLDRVTGGDRSQETPTKANEASPEAPSPPPDPKTLHFVDRHRKELVGRMSPGDEILDELLQEGLLTTEAYDTIRSQRTPQEKMRMLFTYMRGWGNQHKDFFYKVLSETDPCLVKDLEKS